MSNKEPQEVMADCLRNNVIAFSLEIKKLTELVSILTEERDFLLSLVDENDQLKGEIKQLKQLMSVWKNPKDKEAKIARDAFIAAASQFTANTPFPNREWVINFSADEYVRTLDGGSL